MTFISNGITCPRKTTFIGYFYPFQTSNVQEKSLLIMENLFYDCDIDNKFDLKGSKRNRLVDTNNQNGEETVLLDENLIQSKNRRFAFIQFLEHFFKIHIFV